MSEIHQIRELLLAGAQPTDEEVGHLAAMGAFVSSMYGRYLHGASRPGVGAHSEDWTAHLSGLLGASTATRWEQGIGLGESLLADDWAHWWQVARDGFQSGYWRLDAERESLMLFEDEVAKPVAEDARHAPRRRTSLFGRRRPAHVAPRGRRAKAARNPRQHWLGGGTVELATLEALASGGLFVSDQLIGSADVDAIGGSIDAPGAPAPLGRSARKRAWLDGLAIDDRTPALASALTWVESAFGTADADPFGIAVNASRIAAMTPSVDPAVGHGRGGDVRRPVFAFFDAIEGDFLSLYPDAPKAAAKAAATTATAPAPKTSLFAATRPPMVAFDGATATSTVAAPMPRAAAARAASPIARPTSPLTRAAAAAPMQARRDAARAGAVVTSLDRVTPTRAASAAVRPYTEGVFPTLITPAVAATPSAAMTTSQRRASARRAQPQLQLAKAVTYTRSAQPMARAQRTAMSAPRTEIIRVQPQAPKGAAARAGAPLRRPEASATKAATSTPLTFMTQLPTMSDIAQAAWPTLRTIEQSDATTVARPGVAPRATRPTMLGFEAIEGPAEGSPALAGQAFVGSPWLTEATSWRSADDLGPDLPLGASWTAAEATVLSLGTQAFHETAAERHPFRPVIAKGGPAAVGVSAPRPGFEAFSSGFDGVVWVTAEAGADLDATDPALPLSVIPRGRAATQLLRTQAADLVGQSLAARATPQRALQADAPLGFTTAAAAPTAARFMDLVRAQLRAGVLPADMPAVDARRMVGVDLDALTPSGTAGAEAFDATPAGALATGIGVLPESIAATMALADSAGQVATRGGAGEIVSRWLDDARAGFGTSRRAWGAGAFGALDVEREIVRLGLEGPVASATPTAGPAPGRATRTSLFATPSVTPTRQGMTPAAAAAPEPVTAPGRLAAPMAVATPTGLAGAGLSRDIVTRMGARAGAPRGVGAAPALRAASRREATEAQRSIASAARRALQRPVVTGREAREVAQLFTATGPLATALTRTQAARSLSEPALMRTIDQKHRTRDAIMGRAGDLSSPSLGVLGAVAGVAPQDSGSLLKAFRAAGWGRSELEVLSITEPIVIDAAAGKVGLAVALEQALAGRQTAAEQALAIVNRSFEAAKVQPGIASRDAALVSPSLVERTMVRPSSEDVSAAPDDAMTQAVTARTTDVVAQQQQQPAGPTAQASPVAARTAGIEARLATILGQSGGQAASTYLSPSGRPTVFVTQVARELAALGVADLDSAPLAMVRSAVERASGRADAGRQQLGRNLARLVSGAESLGAPVSLSSGSDATLSQRASALSARYMPMLAGARADRYFGASAPERKSGGRAYAGIRDAVGELVAIAKELALGADTAVASEAHRETLRRLVETRGVAAEVARREDSGQDVLRLLGVTAAQRAAAQHQAGGTLAAAERPEMPTIIDEAIAETVFARTALPTPVLDSPMRAISDTPGEMVLRGEGGRREAAQDSMISPKLLALLQKDAANERIIAPMEQGEPTGTLGLRGRISEALRRSTAGPAGAARLIRELGGTATVARALPEIVRAMESQVRRELELSSPTTLDTVLAPEVMLTGLRSRELTQAIEASGGGSAAAKLIERGRLATREGRGGVGAGTADAQPAQSLFSRLASSNPMRVLLSVLSRVPGGVGAFGGLNAALSGGQAMSRRDRAGLMSALVRSSDSRELVSLFQQAGASDFAHAWLDRVDGTRSGIDLGFDDTRAQVSRAFGGRRTMAAAAASPIDGASFVGPQAAAARGDDRSGLRNFMRQIRTTRTGAARSQHGASEAVRRTDWRFVQTGSSRATPHADLGKLAQAIVSSNEASARAPMPLVAPAAKAVAQTALRAPRGSARNSGRGSSGVQGSRQQKLQKSDSTESPMSEKALELLAIEMAARVAKLMGLQKERIGVWS